MFPIYNTTLNIAVLVSTIVATVLIFILVTVARILYKATYFGVTMIRKTYLDPRDVRLNLVFLNESAKATKFIDLSLIGYKEGSKTGELIAPLAGVPLSNDISSTFISRSNNGFCITAKENSRSQAMLEYRIPANIRLDDYLRFSLRGFDGDLKIIEARIKDLKSTSEQALLFKKRKKI